MSNTKLTAAQLQCLKTIAAAGGATEGDMHMGRMRPGDIRKSVAFRLDRMGLLERTRMAPHCLRGHREDEYASVGHLVWNLSAAGCAVLHAEFLAEMAAPLELEVAA